MSPRAHVTLRLVAIAVIALAAWPTPRGKDKRVATVAAASVAVSRSAP